VLRLLRPAGLLLQVCFVLPGIPSPSAAAEPAITTVAFGSCANQNLAQPIWDAIVAAKPDLFLFLGDNVYSDTLDPEVLRSAYAKLAAQEGFERLRRTSRVLATWDDHDYGTDDMGAEHPAKKEMKQVLLDFFEEPAGSERRRREGVYDAKLFGPPGRRVQVILLDTRTFRGRLETGPWADEADGQPGPYLPSRDRSVTLLGAEQWHWLEEQLRKPSEIRIIVSSIQVIAEDHRWEKWGNLPHERERLFDLIERTGVGTVIFLSGDRHAAELSGTTLAGGTPVLDVTSSSLNAPLLWTNEINHHRIGSRYHAENFGLATIDWSGQAPRVTLEIRNLAGTPVIRHEVVPEVPHARSGGRAGVGVHKSWRRHAR